MKFLLLFCFLSIAGTTVAQNSASISGQVFDPTHDSIRISYYTNLINFDRKIATAPIISDGTFSITIPLELPVAAFLEHNFEIVELFLQPGDQLHVAFDAQEVEESLKFSGKGALENKCMAEISRKYADDDDFNYSKKSVYANDDAYLKLVNNKFKWQEKYAEKFLKKYPVSPAFAKWLRSEIFYGSALQKMQYPELRGTIVKIDDPYKLSPEYYSFIAEAEAYPSPDLNSLCYLNYKQELIKYQYRKNNGANKPNDYFLSQYALAKKMLNGETENIVSGRLIIESYKYGHVNFADQMLADYNGKVSNKTFKEVVSRSADYYRPLAKGSIAPELPLLDAKGNIIDLSSLKGKAVYLYFYTLGCGSCQMEVMAARDLANRLDDKDIAFVFVSVDHDYDTWKKVVTKRPWPGVMGQTTDSAATVSAYRLSKYPAAFILDAEGRIFDHSAKRLGAIELKSNLESALVKQRPPVHGQLMPKE